MTRAVVVGTIGVDLVADRPDAPSARASVGNSGANIAMRLAWLGWDVEMIALVGRDDIARIAYDDLRAAGVGVSGVVARPGYLTPRVLQVVADGQSRFLSECPRCGRPRGHRLLVPDPDEVPDTVWERARDARLVVADVAGPTALRAAAGERSLVWYEQSLAEATRSEMLALARVSDVLKCSSDDVVHYRATFDVDGPRARVLTRGADGIDVSRRVSGTGVWPPPEHWPAAAVRVVRDTIGAGDALTATLADAWARGMPDAEAVPEAANAAARVCEAVGALGDRIATAGPRPVVPFRCGRCDAE